jgi:OmpA-OmpF porin, OOP family
MTMMSKKWLVALFGAAAMTASAGALAQQSAAGTGFYVGADVGNADFGSDDDTAFKLYAGFKFHPNVAVEGGWAQLYDKGGSEATALEVVAVGMFPLTPQFTLLGKLGLASVDADSPAGGDTKTELTYGIGVQFEATPKIGVRAQWQRYDTDQEIDLLSVGVVFRF